MEKKTYRLSPTLLNDFRDYQTEVMYGEKYACTEEDLINKLNRVRFPGTEAMLKGIAFEKCLTVDGLYSADGFSFPPNIIDELRHEVRGGIYQFFVDYTIETAEYVARFNCYLDFFLRNKTIDIKTSRLYKFPKFLNSFQHKIYLLGMNAKGNALDTHDYLITDFKEVYHEVYTLQEEAWLADIKEATADLVFFIEARRPMITNPKAFEI